MQMHLVPFYFLHDGSMLSRPCLNAETMHGRDVTLPEDSEQQQIVLHGGRYHADTLPTGVYLPLYRPSNDEGEEGRALEAHRPRWFMLEVVKGIMPPPRN